MDIGVLFALRLWNGVAQVCKAKYNISWERRTISAAKLENICAIWCDSAPPIIRHATVEKKHDTVRGIWEKMLTMIWVDPFADGRIAKRLAVSGKHFVLR